MHKLICKTRDGNVKVITVENNTIKCYDAEMLVKYNPRTQEIDTNDATYTAGKLIGQMEILEEIKDNPSTSKTKHSFLRGEKREGLIKDLLSGKATYEELSDLYNVKEDYIKELILKLDLGHIG